MFKLFVISLLFIVLGCSGPKDGILAELPITSASDSIDDDFEFVTDETLDGNGSFLADSDKESKYIFLNLQNPDVAGSQLNCIVNLKTEMLNKLLILEMTIVMPDGSAKVVSNHNPDLRRTTDWTELVLSYRFKKDEKPEKLLFAMHNQGFGKFWLDDVKVTLGEIVNE